MNSSTTETTENVSTETETTETSALNPPAAPTFDFDALTLPENIVLEDGARDTLGALALEHNITPAALSALAEKFYAPELTKALEMAQSDATAAADTAWTETQAEWRKQLETTYGSSEKVVEIANGFASIIDRFGGKDFREALDVTGFGNHPAAFQFFEKLAEAVKEPGPAGRDGNSPEQGSPLAAMYPTMKGK